MAERRFEDQVALVVGGAQGIGKAIAARLGREGAHVAVADIDRAKMDVTVPGISGARGFFCDVRDGEKVRGMVTEVIAWHGRIDTMLYVAGIAPAAPFLELSEKALDDTLETNLRGAFLVAQAVSRHMVERRRGKLVFMASTNSWDAEPQLAHYNASKSGIYLLAKTLARELGPFGIQSNAVGPGFIRTRLTEAVINDPDFLRKYDPAQGLIPAGRIGEPEDVAGPALFLASSDADYVSGVLLFVDGGQLA